MENKSLNVFNSQRVLASPGTATDTDYRQIERVVGHEYFHNWTGGGQWRGTGGAVKTGGSRQGWGELFSTQLHVCP